MALERTAGDSVEVFVTIEKSLYRVVQDVLKKDRSLFAQSIVEIQDSATFQAATSGQSQAQSAATPQTALAAM